MSSLALYRCGSGPAARDLAFEAWMVEAAAAGQHSLSLYSWPQPVVVLGYAQKADEVDLEWCRNSRISVLRRLTGGTGVVHRRDLAVTLALPGDHEWSRGIVSLYGRFLDALTPGLEAAGGDVRRVSDPRRGARVRSPICFEDQLADTLVRGERKVVGCAQSRRKGAVLIHAAILLDLDAELYSRVFRVSEQRVSQALAPAVPGGNWADVGDHVARHLFDALGMKVVEKSIPDLEERFLARYREPKWAPVRV